MRLWSLHPALLDRRGLVAAWREGLLAQQVLLGRTAGYRRHPQLDRFRDSGAPVAAIGAWLSGVADEASERGYRFDADKIVEKIVEADATVQLPVTTGQLAFEWTHLLDKVRRRDPAWLATIEGCGPRPHPMLQLVPGDIASWERGERGVGT